MEDAIGVESKAASAAESLAGFVSQKLKRFESCLDEALATGDVEAIHGLRVASRRLHEPLDIIAEWAGRRETKLLRRALKRIRGAFRNVRDLDVLMHSLVTAPDGGLTDDERAELEGLLAAQRERALAAAQRRCRKLKFPRTLRALDEICDAVASRADCDDPIRAHLDGTVHALAQQLRACDPQQEDGPDLHAARIQVKRLRYCAELADEVSGRPTGALVDALTRLQNLLGHWNDQVTASRWLGRLASKRTLLARRAAWSAGLLDHAAQRARSAVKQGESIRAEWAALDALVRPWCGNENQSDRESPEHV